MMIQSSLISLCRNYLDEDQLWFLEGWAIELSFLPFQSKRKTYVRVVELEKRRWRKINLRAPVGIQWLDESLNWLIWRRLFLWEIRLICCGVSRDLNSWNLDMVLFYVLLLVYYLLLLLLLFLKKLIVHGLMIQWLLMREMFGVTYKK
jgi:hypothetical protein